MQSKFDFGGLAASVVGAGVGNLVGGDLKGLSKGGDNSLSNHLAHLGTNAASALANAATRSAVSGTNFGDSFKAAIPDVIAQAVYGALANGIQSPKSNDASPVQDNIIVTGEQVANSIAATSKPKPVAGLDPFESINPTNALNEKDPSYLALIQERQRYRLERLVDKRANYTDDIKEERGDLKEIAASRQEIIVAQDLARIALEASPEDKKLGKALSRQGDRLEDYDKIFGKITELEKKRTGTIALIHKGNEAERNLAAYIVGKDILTGKTIKVVESYVNKKGKTKTRKTTHQVYYSVQGKNGNFAGGTL